MVTHCSHRANSCHQIQGGCTRTGKAVPHITAVLAYGNNVCSRASSACHDSSSQVSVLAGSFMCRCQPCSSCTHRAEQGWSQGRRLPSPPASVPVPACTHCHVHMHCVCSVPLYNQASRPLAPHGASGSTLDQPSWLDVVMSTASPPLQGGTHNAAQSSGAHGPAASQCPRLSSLVNS